MKEKDLDELFKELNFDLAEPEAGHKERFLEKLEGRQQALSGRTRVRKLWTPFIAIAASLAVLFMLFGNVMNTEAMARSGDLASVSPEMKETQEFYTAMINKELATIEEEKSPETMAIINDALEQMEKLEKQYEKLKEDLVKSGQDKRVIHAMISNFQQRIDLLNHVMEQIEKVKSLKSQNNESNVI